MHISRETIQSLAQEHGTPLYLYDAEAIRARIHELSSALGQYENTELLYAVKANFNPTIVKMIIDGGIGIDAVSPEEVQLALALNCPREQICFTGNNMTDQEMHTVHGLEVLLNIGSLSRLEKFGAAYPGSDVSVRFNPNVGAASHDSNITGGPDSKFGISFRDVKAVKDIAEKHNLNIIGIHQHIGSGWLSLREPVLALDVILEIAMEFPGLTYINVGGGFGIPYKPGQKRLDLQRLGMAIKGRLDSFVQEYGSTPTLRFEPGRFLVAEAGSLITTVNTAKKSISRRNVVGTDTGMNQLIRPALYGSYHRIQNVSNPDGELMPYDVTGNICECADYFARDREIPEISEGDLLSIEDAGAYGMAMAGNYQLRGLPPEILVDGEKSTVIRERETFETLFGRFPSVQ